MVGKGRNLAAKTDRHVTAKLGETRERQVNLAEDRVRCVVARWVHTN